ncbi:MAG: xylann 1,4-beta-xylosidase, partial [Firmicutes bacterium]|nr:xylann 1,4-beta-xylosidase [Bacillota bacterium]
EEVRSWYFEVWNEPNLKPFWDGSRSRYFELYRVTAQTIKAIDPHLRVGGPATSNFVPDARFDGEYENTDAHRTHQVDDLSSLNWHGVWIKEFLAFCQLEKLPVDFVSAHPYPTDFALDQTGLCVGRSRNADATYVDVKWLRDVVRQSAFPRAEIHMTEWSSSPSSRDCSHDFIHEAAYIVRTNLQCAGLVDSLSYWTFTDVFEEHGAGDSIFHGGFGMINYQGIVKPSFHAYRMLNALGDELLHIEDGLAVTRRGSLLQALLYHYPIKETICMSPFPNRAPAEVLATEGEPLQRELVICNAKPHAIFTLDVLDAEHGWAYPRWKEMQCPDTPSREQTHALRSTALHTKKQSLQADADGTLHLSLSLSPWSVTLLEELP